MFSLFDAFNLMHNYRSQASLARQMENQAMAQLQRANEDARYPHQIDGELVSAVWEARKAR
jgi:hypothetical protein